MASNVLTELGRLLIEAQMEETRRLATRPFYVLNLAKIDHELDHRELDHRADEEKPRRKKPAQE